MEKYYKERFHFQEKLISKIAPFTDAGEIIEAARDELRSSLEDAVEVCILLLDPEAENYTRPIQCALHKRPFNCQACKPDRPAVLKAVDRKKGVIITKSPPIVRPGHDPVRVGPEYAVPLVIENEVLGIVSVVTRPDAGYQKRDFFLIRDVARLLSGIVLNARKQWRATLEKIRISKALTNISPFVPTAVRDIAGRDPDMLNMEKKRKPVTILFLDLEGYTRLSNELTETVVNDIIERMFSSFVDPIHRSQGTINETAGDGLMIIFEKHDPETNAVNAVKAAFEIADRARSFNCFLNNTTPVHVNMGINSGTALVGIGKFTGALNTRMTYTASGSVTNIAARLSDYARGGDILMGPETCGLVNGIWPVFDAGRIHLKGMDGPVQVYSLWRTPVSGQAAPDPP